MRILLAGHVYLAEEVGGVRGQEAGHQTIAFVRRRDEHARLLPPDEQAPGLLSQELLRVLIDRVRYLNDEDPCVEDVEILGRLRDALRPFETRAARRTIEKLPMPETAPACPLCHHLLCVCECPERLRHEVRR